MVITGSSPVRSTMTTTEIKKALYKEKPIAKKVGMDRCMHPTYYYEAELTIGVVEFEVPYKDRCGTDFNDEMSAQHLIRWLVEKQQ